MKKILFISLAFCAVVAFGQDNKQTKAANPVKPKVAVYVTGGDEAGINGFVGDYLVDAIVRSGKYTAVERTSDFLKKLNKEHEYQRSGNVDDEQISKLGKQFGAQLVCVAKVGYLDYGYYLSARLIDVETATVTKSSKPIPFSMDNLSEVCEDATTQLFGIAIAPTFGKPKSVN